MLPIWKQYEEEYAHPPFSLQHVTKKTYADISDCTKMIFYIHDKKFTYYSYQ